MLARLLLAGPFTVRESTLRIRSALGRCPHWLNRRLKTMVAELGEGSRPRQQRLQRMIHADEGFQKAVHGKALRFRQRPGNSVLCPAKGAPETWTLPSLISIQELSDYLGLTAGELEWFADLKSLNPQSTESRLQHYRYRWQPKIDGSARLIESPKSRLKHLQRLLLGTIINRIPPHEAAHGFRSGRSTRTFVAPHVGQEIVLRMDLRDFFPSITRARIIALLLTAGHPEPIALRLAGICTSRVPSAVLENRPPGRKSNPSESFRLRKLFETPHLPQGAPSSPALANLTAHRLDCRLTGLATAAGAHYTRYADDLVFSGGAEFARKVERFAHHVCVVAFEEGFEVHTRKTRIMRKSVSQRAAGLVINEGIRLPRKEVDSLKAILHNCARLGPTSQNHGAHPDFRAHLLGRISHLSTIHATRAAKLRRDFDQIDWSR